MGSVCVCSIIVHFQHNAYLSDCDKLWYAICFSQPNVRIHDFSFALHHHMSSKYLSLKT